MTFHPKAAATALLVLISALPAAQADSSRSDLDLRLAGTSGGGAIASLDGAPGLLKGEVEDGLGWGVRGRLVFAERWHLYGEWSTSNTSLRVTPTEAPGNSSAGVDSDFDLDRISIGLGYQQPINDEWSWFGRLTWDLMEFGDFDQVVLAESGPVTPVDLDDSGLGATVGVRWDKHDWALSAWARYTAVGEVVADERGNRFDNDLGGGLQLVYQFTDSLGLGVDYELNDIDTWSVIFRYRF